MVFSSLIFMCIFLPIVLIAYNLSKNLTYKNTVLIIASLFFYAWGEPIWVVLLIFSAFVDYINGRIIDKYYARAGATIALVSSLVINLGLLAMFKYSGFFIENINTFLHTSIPNPNFKLPIGISFYTFQTLSYTIDMYRGKTRVQKSFLGFLAYVSMFPQLVAGPIVRYSTVASELNSRRVTADDFAYGVKRFTAGMCKKVMLANSSGAVASMVLDSTRLTVASSWLGIIMYTFQIYFDFSGYSDMAIGLGKMFGFHIHENFNHPYTATSIKDFWRRWHISLSTWFKEYLYIPLGGNREGTLKTYRNLMIVFFLTGLWHGASWNFVIWGLFHGTFLVLERIFPIEKILHFRLLKSIYTLLVVIVAWVFFRAETLGSAWAYLNRMFVPYDMESYSKYLSNEFVYVAVLALASCGFGAMLYRRLFALIGRENWGNAVVRAVNPAFCAVIAYFSVLLLASNTYNPFIYFRF